MPVLTPDAERVLPGLSARQRAIVDEHLRDEDADRLSADELADLFWERARESRLSEPLLAGEFDRLAVAFRPDPLYPLGGRPACSRCRQRPVYLKGLCGDCYAAEGRS